MEPASLESDADKTPHSPTRRRSLFLPGVCVGAIVIVVLAIVLSAPLGPTNSSTRALTRVTLKALAAILISYREETGRIPPNVNSMITSASTMPSFKKAIDAMPSGALTTTSYGTYTVLDGFGNPIVLVNTPGNPRSPYFQSAGPDGILGTADDMFSYDP